MSDTTKAKHTPGPWEADALGSIRSVGGWFVAEALHAESEAKGQANARLIAAAPDLLRACRGLLLVAERMDADLTAKGRGYPMGTVPGFDGYQLFDAVRAILSAATGEG